jgi:predicted outer membrane protein
MRFVPTVQSGSSPYSPFKPSGFTLVGSLSEWSSKQALKNDNEKTMKKTVPTLIMAISVGVFPMLASAAITATRTTTVTTTAASRTNAVVRTNTVAAISTTGVTNTLNLTNGTIGDLTRADAHFLAVVAVNSLHAIAIGFLAQTNSTNADVVAFGAVLVATRTAAYNDAVELASSNNVALPTTETRVQLGQTGRLALLNGSRFDIAFDNIIKASLLQDISLFDGEAIRAISPAVRAYARAQLLAQADNFVRALLIREALTQSSSSQ